MARPFHDDRSRSPMLVFRLSPADVDRLIARKGFFVTLYGRGQGASVWADARG